MRTGVPVVDASVAVKWVVDEELSDQAYALLDNAAAHDEFLRAPPHLPSEVINALYRRTRRATVTTLTPVEAQLAMRRFLGISLVIVEPPGLYERAFALAEAHHLPTVYDALYVVLADLLGVDLWTGDQRLYNSVRSAAPWVRWIGDYEASP